MRSASWNSRPRETCDMTAFAHHLGFEFKSGLRNSTSMLMYYLFPLGFYVADGAGDGGDQPGLRRAVDPLDGARDTDGGNAARPARRTRRGEGGRDLSQLQGERRPGDFDHRHPAAGDRVPRNDRLGDHRPHRRTTLRRDRSLQLGVLRAVDAAERLRARVARSGDRCRVDERAGRPCCGPNWCSCRRC